MKAITLTQPWATLVAIGAKRFETRSWGTHYRGPLAIHAAKSFPLTARALLRHPHFEAALAGMVPLHRDPDALPRGAVVAVAELRDVVRTEQVRFPALTEAELSFGDFSPGRHAWYLGNVQPLADPIEARGALRLWDWVPPVDEHHCDACWDAWINEDLSPHVFAEETA